MTWYTEGVATVCTLILYTGTSALIIKRLTYLHLVGSESEKYQFHKLSMCNALRVCTIDGVFSGHDTCARLSMNQTLN